MRPDLQQSATAVMSPQCQGLSSQVTMHMVLCSREGVAASRPHVKTAPWTCSAGCLTAAGCGLAALLFALSASLHSASAGHFRPACLAAGST